MDSNLKIAIIYVYPDMLTETYGPLARRFVNSYMQHPPGERDHDIHVVINYGQEGGNYTQTFRPLSCQYTMHNNRGKDIGAFQVMAKKLLDYDLMVCLGANIHFIKAGWLDRIANAYEENGPGLYGCWAFHQPAVHIRTTAFWCSPQLLDSYPYVVHNDSRYEFEHGQKSIVNHVTNIGFNSFQVTWGGCYPIESWHHVPNDQCLFLDQFCDRIGFK